MHKPHVAVVDLIKEAGVSAKEIFAFIRHNNIKVYTQDSKFAISKEDAKKFQEESLKIFNPDITARFKVDNATLPKMPEIQIDDPDIFIRKEDSNSLKGKRLGEILLFQGIVTEENISKALKIQSKRGGIIGQILVDMGIVMEEEILLALALQSDMDLILDLAQINVPRNIIDKVPERTAKLYHIAPLKVEKGALVIATDQPQNKSIFRDLNKLLNVEIKGAVSSAADIEACIQKIYPHRKNRTKAHRSISVRTKQIKETLPKSNKSVNSWYEEGTTFDERKKLGRRIFLAMPFAINFEPVFDSIITVSRITGTRLLRIDQVPNLRNIWTAIEREIERADILIADFTGDRYVDIPNPNVVTEATIAFHKYEMPVIIITQTIDALFFDWRHHFAITYNPDDDGLHYLRRTLTNKIEAEVAELDRQDSLLKI